MYQARSRSSEYQTKKNLESFEATAKSTHNIVAIWKRQQELNIALSVEYTVSTLHLEMQHTELTVRVGRNGLMNFPSGSDGSDPQSLKQERIGK